MVLNLEVETDVVYIDLADSLPQLGFSAFFSVLFFFPYFLYFLYKSHSHDIM
jgi:hypothetical protein